MKLEEYDNEGRGLCDYEVKAELIMKVKQKRDMERQEKREGRK